MSFEENSIMVFAFLKESIVIVVFAVDEFIVLFLEIMLENSAIHNLFSIDVSALIIQSPSFQHKLIRLFLSAVWS